MSRHLIDKYHYKIPGSHLDPCVYCGSVAKTIDHIEPLSKGGAKKDIQNWAPMCSNCNNNKGNDSVLMAFFNPALKMRISHNIRTEKNKRHREFQRQARTQYK